MPTDRILDVKGPVGVSVAGKVFRFRPPPGPTGLSAFFTMLPLAVAVFFLIGLGVTLASGLPWSTRPVVSALLVLMEGGLASVFGVAAARMGGLWADDVRFNASKYRIIVGFEDVTLVSVRGRERMSFGAALRQRWIGPARRVVEIRARCVEVDAPRGAALAVELVALGGADRVLHDLGSGPICVAVQKTKGGPVSLGAFSERGYGNACDALPEHDLFMVPVRRSGEEEVGEPVLDPSKVNVMFGVNRKRHG